MAEKKKPTSAESAKNAVEEVVVEAPTEAPTEPAKAKPTKVRKLDDTVRVNVRSNTYGELIYVNPRTGDTTVWSGYGDDQTVTMGDLRAMKGSQRAFYENNWIYVLDIEDEGFEDVTPADVYKTLLVSQYYTALTDPASFARLFRSDNTPERVRSTVKMLSAGARTNLILAANAAIENGTLDSMRLIRTFEDALGCELNRPE